MSRIQVKGTEKLGELARVLEHHDEAKSIRRVLSKSIRDAAKPITDEQRRNLAEKMPHRGGLAEALASQGKFTIRTSLAGKSVNVTLTDSWKGHDMQAIDAGSLRHPLFGNRRYWYTQRVPAGQLSKPVILGKRRLQGSIIHGLDSLAADIDKEIR